VEIPGSLKLEILIHIVKIQIAEKLNQNKTLFLKNVMTVVSGVIIALE